MKKSLKVIGVFLFTAMLVSSLMMTSCKKDSTPDPNAGKTDPSTIATDSLVAYFPFDGNGVDEIASLTPEANSHVTYIAGRRNQCYQGDSLAYLLYTLPSTSKLATMTKGFTIACWLKPTKVYGDPVPTIFAIGNSENLTWGNITWMQERLDETADTCFFKFHFQAVPGEVWAAANTSPDIIAGRWAHYVISYDGATSILKVYKDGVIIEKMTYELVNAGDLAFVNVNNLIIGGWLSKVIASATDAWMGWFKGNIDELRVYNAGLSASRAKALYDAEVTQID